MNMGMLKIFGKNGSIYRVNQGIGLGVRQHDDVMLSYGYSHKVEKKITLPAGDYSMITLTVPENVNHHAEGRSVVTYNGTLEFAVILGLTEVQVTTGTKEQIPAFNMNGPYRNDNVDSLFHFRGIQTTDPILGLHDENNEVDTLTLYGQTGQGNRASEKDVFESVKGRYYTYNGGDNVYTVLLHNPNGANIDVTYSYSWHEFIK